MGIDLKRNKASKKVFDETEELEELGNPFANEYQ